MGIQNRTESEGESSTCSPKILLDPAKMIAACSEFLAVASDQVFSRRELPPLGHFMFSECSSYNLDCFSVLTTYPEVTCDRGATWSREEISERGASEGPTLQGEVEGEAVCNLPICLCGRTGSGPKVLGHGIPWVACDQTSVGNPAGGNSEA